MSERDYWQRITEQEDNKTKKEQTMTEKINSPSHYTTGEIEVIDYIEDQLTPDQFFGYCVANGIKYLSRAKHKGDDLGDIQKARWYMDRLIENIEKSRH